VCRYAVTKLFFHSLALFSCSYSCCKQRICILWLIVDRQISHKFFLGINILPTSLHFCQHQDQIIYFKAFRLSTGTKRYRSFYLGPLHRLHPNDQKSTKNSLWILINYNTFFATFPAVGQGVQIWCLISALIPFLFFILILITWRILLSLEACSCFVVCVRVYVLIFWIFLMQFRYIPLLYLAIQLKSINCWYWSSCHRKT